MLKELLRLFRDPGATVESAQLVIPPPGPNVVPSSVTPQSQRVMIKGIRLEDFMNAVGPDYELVATRWGHSLSGPTLSGPTTIDLVAVSKTEDEDRALSKLIFDHRMNEDGIAPIDRRVRLDKVKHVDEAEELAELERLSAMMGRMNCG